MKEFKMTPIRLGDNYMELRRRIEAIIEAVREHPDAAVIEQRAAEILKEKEDGMSNALHK